MEDAVPTREQVIEAVRKIDAELQRRFELTWSKRLREMAAERRRLVGFLKATGELPPGIDET